MLGLIPYYDIPVLEWGPIVLDAWATLVALGFMLGLEVARARAIKLGLDVRDVIDGIVAMEGDGPIMGTARPFGAVVMGDNLPAVDAHTCRLMGLRPEKMPYLEAAAKAGGTIHPWRIQAVGDAIAPEPFHILDHLSHLRA